jgi:hypothetical protein
MTLGQIDGYLFKPWRPLERWLYLPVSELLADWEKAQAPTVEPVRIVGRRWQARAHEIRDFFSRGGLPYGFYEAESQAGRRLLEEAGQDGTRLPVLVFYTGTVLVDPSTAELVEALGSTPGPIAKATTSPSSGPGRPGSRRACMRRRLARRDLGPFRAGVGEPLSSDTTKPALGSSRNPTRSISARSTSNPHPRSAAPSGARAGGSWAKAPAAPRPTSITRSRHRSASRYRPTS